MKTLRKAKKAPVEPGGDEVCPVCRRKKPDAAAELVERVLEKVEEKLETAELKPTVGDYLRLLQFREEMKLEEPKEIRVTWVESEKESKT